MMDTPLHSYLKTGQESVTANPHIRPDGVA